MGNKTLVNLMSLSNAVFIILLICKAFDIGNVGDWSWWIITAPLWIPLIIGIFIIFTIILKDKIK